MSGVPRGNAEVGSDLSEQELAVVASVMESAGEGLVGPLQSTHITGGRSNVTQLIGDGVQQWVLRMPPKHGRTPSAHDVGREYKVARALFETNVPVPRPVAYCTDDTLIGVPFAVLGYCRGESVQTRKQLDQISESALAEICHELVSVLARIHAVDHEAVGLGAFGRPDNYAQRQLRRWSGQWDLVGDAELTPLATRVVDLLWGALPAQRTTSLVHGDFRIDNTLITMRGHGGSPEVVAVVDWELSTLGDPVADVAMMCAYRDPAFDQVLGIKTAWASPRLPDSAELAAQYERAGGARLADWHTHLGLAHYKIAVIAAGIAHRSRASGAVSGTFAEAAQAVEPYLARSLFYLLAL